MSRKVKLGILIGIITASVIGLLISLRQPSETRLPTTPAAPAAPAGPRTVSAVFPVTVDAFLQFQKEAREVLEAEGVDVSYFSAEGDPTRFQTVVNAALLKNPDVLVLVGTQLTNTGLAPRYAGSLPPVVSSCISDPSKVEQLTAIGLDPPRSRDVAVLTDMPRQDAYSFGADLIRRVTPDIKKAGVMFNNAEINSKNTAMKISSALEAVGIEVIDGIVTSEEDVDKVARNLVLEGAQLLIIPHDKYVIKKAPTVVKIGLEAPNGPVPVFSLDDGTVRKDGAAYGVSVDYGYIGRITAETCLKIMQGTNPRTMPIIQQDTASAYFNADSWQKLGLPPLPGDIRDGAVIFGGE